MIPPGYGVCTRAACIIIELSGQVWGLAQRRPDSRASAVLSEPPASGPIILHIKSKLSGITAYTHRDYRLRQASVR